jgi:hypothetical protein
MIAKSVGSMIAATAGVISVLIFAQSIGAANPVTFLDGYYSDAVAGGKLAGGEPNHGLLVEGGKVVADFSFDDFGCLGRMCDFERLVRINKYTQINDKQILRITPAGSRVVVTWYKGSRE